MADRWLARSGLGSTREARQHCAGARISCLSISEPVLASGAFAFQACRCGLKAVEVTNNECIVDHRSDRNQHG